MLGVPVFDMQGKSHGEQEIDPAILGGWVHFPLLKQAIVGFLDHQRQDSARQKSRSDVVGSGRKLYRQKGTGNARVGNIRTPTRRGGGRAFAKRGPRAVVKIPKKMRRLARNSAILAKIESSDVMIVKDFQLSEIKTKTVAAMLSALGITKGCVFATHERDDTAVRSTRNIPNADVRVVDELAAYEVLRRKKLIFTASAFERLVGGASDSGSDTADA